MIQQSRRGAKIVMDLDDDLPSIPHWSPAKPLFNSSELVYLRESLAMADHVTCSTAELARSTEEWYPFVKGQVVVLENLINPGTFFRQSTTSDLIKILWTGSTTHVGDLGPLHAITRLIQTVPGYLLVTYGPLPPWAANAKNVTNISWSERMFYESTLSLIAPDIALLPLLDCRFNRCKSVIKFLECTMAGALCVASDVPPFSAAIQDQVTGLLVRHEDGDRWMSVVRDYKSRDPRDVKDMKENAYKEVIDEYSWKTDNPRRRAWRDFFVSLAR
jgi:hypothetical protein